MKIIKDKKIVDDKWAFVPENEPLPTGDITVPLSRWHSEKDKLLDHKGNIGIRLEADEQIDEIIDELDKFNLIEINFPAFTDGRCFSMARLLRSRYHYEGELRATGQFMRDQIFYLSRVGFNSMKLEDIDDLEGAVTALDDFTVKYQQSSI